MAKSGLDGFYREGSLFSAYMDAVARVAEAPERFHLAAQLAILGATLGRKVLLPYGPHRLYPITPTILVGPSGIGKGEAMGIAREVLKRLRQTTVDGTKRQNIWILQDEATPAALVRCYTMHPWGEAADPSLPAPEIAIIAGEMATFVAKTGEKEGMIPILTKLLEQDASYVRTLVKDLAKKDHQVIQDPTLSFIGGTTLDWMRKMMPSEMFAGGFFRRCIVVCEESKGQSLDWPEHLGKEELAKLVAQWKTRLGPWMEKTGTTKMSMDGAKDYWISFKRRHDRGAPHDPKMVGHYNSHPQHVLRSAMTFALAQGRLDITPQDIRDGEAWITSLLPDLYKILLAGEAHGFTELCQTLERIMLDQGRISRKQLWRKLMIPQKQFDELIEWAKTTGLLVADKPDKDNGESGQWYRLAGRKKTTWGKPR